MAADFFKALPTVLAHEGYLSDDKDDRGGITNFGVSLRFLEKTGDLNKDSFPDGDINRDGTINSVDIKVLSRDDVEELYKLYWWDKNNYAAICDQDIATKIFDLAVNMGSHAAHICAQRAVRAAIGLQLVEDGILGHATITAINMCKPEILMPAIKSEAAGYYRSIKAVSASKYIKGWLRRAYDTPLKENKI